MGKPRDEKSIPKTIEGVSIGEIKRRRNLSGTWHHFGYSTKEEFDAAGVSDLRMVREYIRPVSERKAEEKKVKTEEAVAAFERYEAERDAVEGVEESNIENFERKVEKRVAQYLEDFETSAVTDVDNLRNLASAQIRLESIQETRLRQMAKPVEQQITKIARDVFRALGEEEKALLQQVRLLQKSMGIDKPARDAKTAEVTGVDRVQAIVQEAKRFLANEMEDMCHCGIRTTWVSDLFPETYGKFIKQCPRCGGIIIEEHGAFEWHNGIECPLGCGGVLVKEDGCVKCPNCGWKCCVGEGIEFVAKEPANTV